VGTANAGTERFKIVRQIGQGGMGVVYEAHDSLRNETVALKTLQHVGGESLYRFKREFRSLAEFSHPNLVALYELIADEEEWSFTMELVRGHSFVKWIRGDESTRFVDTIDESPTVLNSEAIRSRLEARPPASGEVSVRGATLPAPDAEVFARVRRAFTQLAQALAALHDVGWLHGDVKPSNVLVTNEGRVVVLDFGVITELRGESEEEIVGTPNYMAPEQLRSEPPTAASDWYAFGVMLFESLTGKRPIDGGPHTVLAVKAFEPTTPALGEIPAHVPRDLAELCVDLLRVEPAARPAKAEIFHRLGVEPASLPPLAVSSASFEDDCELVGRSAALGELRQALSRVDRGKGQAVLVHAPSGMGKTALVDVFLRSLEGRDALVLAGRCYEREAVPYKAIDSLVDALCRWLRGQPAGRVEHLLPEDTGALVTAFPVLQRLDSAARRATRSAGNQTKIGPRALTALASLLSRIATEERLVIFIDDLQWGDLDSTALLSKLVTPDGPRLLFIGSYRSEHSSESPLLRALAEAARLAPGALVELALEPLTVAELEQLARHRLRGAGVPDELATHVARQANGSPYFAQELARHAATSARRGDSSSDEMSLHSVLLARVTRLSNEAKALLEVIAVAGMPLARSVIEHAAQLNGANKPFLELATAHFTRAGVTPDEDAIVTAHDAVREAVTESLSPDRLRTLHRAVANALEATGEGRADIHQLAHHFFHAWPDVPGQRVFELCREAAAQAARSHAYAQAYDHLERARHIAQETKSELRRSPSPYSGSLSEATNEIELDVSFEKLYGGVAARVGHMDPAAAALRRALPKATSALERAELRLSLARISLGQLDTGAARAEAHLGLTELGHETPRASVRGAATALSLLLRAQWIRRVRRSKIGSLSGEARTRARVAASLFNQASASAYFQMDRLSLVQVPIHAYATVLAVGDSAELADWYVSTAVIVSAVGRVDLAQSFIEEAQGVADRMRDPTVTARVMEFRAHVLHFAGKPKDAERVMVECLTEHGQWLENADYLTAVADLAWNALMRGKAELGWRWVLRGIERTAIDGAESRLTKGHTYLCYAGPLLARLGRPDEGRRRLLEFRALLGDGRWDSDESRREPWRRGQWLAHWTLFHAIIGDVGEEFEWAVQAFHAFRFPPRTLTIVLRQFYVGYAWGRLLQLDRAKSADRERANTRWLEARTALESTASHPTLRAHLAVLDAKYEVLQGAPQRALQHILEAERLGHADDNVWVLDETEKLRSSLPR
jgi:hypothetical protein